MTKDKDPSSSNEPTEIWQLPSQHRDTRYVVDGTDTPYFFPPLPLNRPFTIKWKWKPKLKRS